MRGGFGRHGTVQQDSLYRRRSDTQDLLSLRGAGGQRGSCLHGGAQQKLRAPRLKEPPRLAIPHARCHELWLGEDSWRSVHGAGLEPCTSSLH